MSKGPRCVVFEPAKDKWFYAVQNRACPAKLFRWGEHAACCGPFSEESTAIRHLNDGHAVTGWLTRPLEEMRDVNAWRELVLKADKPAFTRGSAGSTRCYRFYPSSLTQIPVDEGPHRSRRRRYER